MESARAFKGGGHEWERTICDSLPSVYRASSARRSAAVGAMAGVGEGWLEWAVALTVFGRRSHEVGTRRLGGLANEAKLAECKSRRAQHSGEGEGVG